MLVALSSGYSEDDTLKISKNMVNAVMLLARESNIIKTLKGKSLSTAPVLLSINGKRTFQDAIIRSDSTYLEAIHNLPEPFDLDEVALALYGDKKYVPYLRQIMQSVNLSPVD